MDKNIEAWLTVFSGWKLEGQGFKKYNLLHVTFLVKNFLCVLNLT